MKKILFLIALLVTTISASSQTFQGDQALLFQAGYQSNYNRALLGVQYRYSILDNLRVAPDATFLFPKDKTTGLDLNVNVHYVFELDYQLSAYPLAGLNMANNRFSGKTISGKKIDSNGWTDWGFNLGGGLGYNLFGGNSFINLEAKYIFSSTDAFVFSLGYGFRF